MSRALRLSRRIEADLRNYPGRCVALDTGGECLVCWKALDAEARVLSRPDVVISARLVYAEWEARSAFGSPGDTLSLYCYTTDYTHSGLARLGNKRLVEYLGRQRTVKIILLDERLDVVGEKHVEWDERKRDEAKLHLERLLAQLANDPVGYHAFLRDDRTLQVAYTHE